MRWLWAGVKGVLNVMAGAIKWATTHPLPAAAVGITCLIAGLFLEDGVVRDVVSGVGWFMLTSAATGWIFQKIRALPGEYARSATDTIQEYFRQFEPIDWGQLTESGFWAKVLGFVL